MHEIDLTEYDMMHAVTAFADLPVKSSHGETGKKLSAFLEKRTDLM